MNNDVMLQRFVAEAARLDRVIEDAERQRDEVRELIELYRKHAPRVTAAESIGAAAARVQQVLEERRGPAITKKDQILSNCEDILSDGQPRFSKDLVRELAKRGVDIGGKSDPATAVASYLCREPDLFVSNRRAGGWTLKRLVQKAKPDDVGASSGFLSSSHGAGERRPTAG